MDRPLQGSLKIGCRKCRKNDAMALSSAMSITNRKRLRLPYKEVVIEGKVASQSRLLSRKNITIPTEVRKNLQKNCLRAPTVYRQYPSSWRYSSFSAG